jgi:formylglycine-generating enzyme required for sulfatase activity
MIHAMPPFGREFHPPTAMQHSALILALAGVLATGAIAQQQPVVSNVNAAQRPASKFVDISYDLAYGGGAVTVWVDVSNDGGRSYIVPAKTFQGHIGQGVTPGTSRAIVWDAAADFDGMLAEQMRVRVTARAGTVPVPPPHMVFIPGGQFYMGERSDGSGAGTHPVYISAMFMDR